MRDTTVSVIGLGASGLSAARLALQKGEVVYVSDASNESRLDPLARELRDRGADVDLGFHDLERIADSGLVVASPGIPPEAPVLRALRARGVRWISEPEFAVRFYQGPLIAVTGTNGKTTTTTLIAHLLEESGLRAGLGGNVGGGLAPPASELALLDPPPDWYVLELSSFQLADTETLAPAIGVVTNLAADHLDRYPDVAAYYSDKARLFRNAGASDQWVLNGEDPATLSLPGEAPGRRHRFAWNPPGSAFVREGTLTLALEPEGGGGPEVALIPLGELPLLGRHNVLNALAASLTAALAGARPTAIREGLRSFRPLPHRLEPVLDRGGVLWVNDSKATNVAASAGALGSLDRPVVLLLGGKDKGEDFRPLAAALRQATIRTVLLFGSAAGRLEEVLREESEDEGAAAGPAPAVVRVAGGLDGAVEAAARTARPGDVVLLSPACSSFDEFSDYAERGRRFREQVLGAAGSGPS